MNFFDEPEKESPMKGGKKSNDENDETKMEKRWILKESS